MAVKINFIYISAFIVFVGLAGNLQVHLYMEIYKESRMIKNSKGFTLIEVIIVVTIIGILAAISIPAISSWLPNYRLKAAARELYSGMQKARMVAVKTNTTSMMTFTSGVGTPCEGGSYTFTDGNGNSIVSVIVDKGVCISPSSTFPGGFNSDGTTSGTVGTVILTHIRSNRTYQLTQAIAGGMSLR